MSRLLVISWSVPARAAAQSLSPQHFLNFFPDPQVQGSLRPTLAVARR